MKTLKSLEIVVVDANPILSGLIKGSALKVFWSFRIRKFATTEFTLEEVKLYIPKLANKSGQREEILLLDLSLLPIKIYSKDFYKDQLDQANERIGKRDPKDVDLLALALRLRSPIWSNDRDFEGIGVECFSTAELLKILNIR